MQIASINETPTTWSHIELFESFHTVFSRILKGYCSLSTSVIREIATQMTPDFNNLHSKRLETTRMRRIHPGEAGMKALNHRLTSAAAVLPFEMRRTTTD